MSNCSQILYKFQKKYKIFTKFQNAVPPTPTSGKAQRPASAGTARHGTVTSAAAAASSSLTRSRRGGRTPGCTRTVASASPPRDETKRD
jgi:hypothetical protein